MTQPRGFIIGLFVVVALAAAAVGIYLVFVDDEASSGGSEIKVASAAMGTEINDQRQIINPTRIFPRSATTIYAALSLQGVRPGLEVIGHWFQLSAPDAPEGKEVNAGGITLEPSHIFEGSSSRVVLTQNAPNGLPPGDWLVRVYADGRLIRSMGFVVAPDATPTPTPTPTGGARPTATPTPR